MKVCIKDGIILTETNEFIADVLIDGKEITAIGKDLAHEADQIINAKGFYVMPGGVDEHTHYGSFNSLSFETSLAAIAGGTTTIVDFVPQKKGQGLLEALHIHKDRAKRNLWANIAFHSTVMDVNDKTILEINSLPFNGVNTLKMFMAYKGTPYYTDDLSILKIMKKVKDSGITMMLHAENADMIDLKTKELLLENHIEPYFHARARTEYSEVEAVSRAINFAKEVGIPIFFVHISSEKALDVIKEEQKKGYPIFCETCTHYLTLTEDILKSKDLSGCNYICSPPLRTRKDNEALWKGLNEGNILAVSSDHCAVRGGVEFKQKNFIDFSKVPNGMPGVQHRLHVLWTKGVCESKISKQKFIKVFSSEPARVCGLNKKGQILPGYDADIVIFDSNTSRVLKNEDSLEGCGYSAFNDMEIRGKVKYTLVNGVVVAKDEKPFLKNGKIEYTEGYGSCWNY